MMRCSTYKRLVGGRIAKAVFARAPRAWCSQHKTIGSRHQCMLRVTKLMWVGRFKRVGFLGGQEYTQQYKKWNKYKQEKKTKGTGTQRLGLCCKKRTCIFRYSNTKDKKVCCRQLLLQDPLGRNFSVLDQILIFFELFLFVRRGTVPIFVQNWLSVNDQSWLV